MNTKLNAYLSFKDNARQAMEFYKSVFGGKLVMSTFKEYHASQSPSEDNMIMHAELETENGIAFFASDTPSRMEYRPGTNFSMSLSGDNEAELTNYFGMCTDPFGVAWLVNITKTKA
jgi:PhnB protein